MRRATAIYKKVAHLRKMKLLASLSDMRKRGMVLARLKHRTLEKEGERIRYRENHLGAVLRRHRFQLEQIEDAVTLQIEIRKALLEAMGLTFPDEE